MPLAPGARLGPYEIIGPIGVGGMGEVYRARHLKLGRDVAIKVLPSDFAADPDRLARFEREARSASSLNQPNIVTIYDIAEDDGTSYIAMELVEGRTLRELIAEGPLSIDQTIHLGSQIVDGLSRAHSAGIVHRDIKPANIMVTLDGLAKILDFGLAKPFTVDRGATTLQTAPGDTRGGMIVGTPAYMSPEQISGEHLDRRSDQFAFGTVLYEMLGGRPPFEGPSLQSIISAILTRKPPPLRTLRADTPADLERIIFRCLEKDPGNRFASTDDLRDELHNCAERRKRAAYGPAAMLRRPAVMATLAVVVLSLTTSGWMWSRGAGKRWAEHDAIGQITHLTETGELYEAYRLALRAQKYRPGDSEIGQLLDRITIPVSVTTVPPGAEVFVRGYATPDAAWERVGVTPLKLRTPYAMMRWRITKAGFDAFEGAPFSGPSIQAMKKGLVLDSAGKRPQGTVRIPAGVAGVPSRVSAPGEPVAQVETFFLDEYEVTNRQFKKFVDAGGYQRPELWPTSIERHGAPISLQQAINRFRDATGRSGPSTWELGRYPEGEEDYPVGGISWYEAAAYCAFAGKQLPTIYHWFSAIGQEQISDILRHSNFGTDRKARAGQFKGLAAFGNYDLAGNVKEWVWNAVGDKRFILGGAYNEPAYVFRNAIAEDPWGREPANGLRCAVYPQPPAAHLLAAVTLRRNYAPPPPLTSAEFALLRGLYAYDRTPLDARVESVDDSSQDQRRQVVSIRTAYGNERMNVILFLPRGAQPPYQSVIWFPGGDVFLFRSSEHLGTSYLFDFIPRSGRVLVYPIYKGTYERGEPPGRSATERRDMMIRWSQDLGRTIDYLKTRPDFDPNRIAFYGFSTGAVNGTIFTAVDSRFAASIFLGGGLAQQATRPEANPAVFAPHSLVPTLMINGRDDFIFPYDVSQQPLLAALGTRPDQKRLARLEGGHIPSNRVEIIREVLDWLDRYLGPVQLRP